MNELKSYTEYAVSTPTADFVIGFDFNYGEDAVNVTVDDVPATEAGYTVVYLNETTIRLSPSVPSGVVRLQRETDIDQTDHAYRAGAKFIAQTMDENFEQLRHSQQEVRDGFVKLSDDTYEIIDTLEEVGQSAQDAADAAEVAAALANNAAAQVNDKVSYADFNNKPHNAMLDRDAASAHPTSSILDASGETQQQVNYNGGSKWHSRVGGYLENERVVLTNGDIVKSTIPNNINDPNVNMTGWVHVGNLVAVDTILDLISISNPTNGMLAFAKGFHKPTNFALAQPYKGGSDFVYNSARSSVNDSCMCFYGWERVGITEVDATLAGALADGTGRKLTDLYTTAEYELLYGLSIDVDATIDTIALRSGNKYVSDKKSISVKPAFQGSDTFHIKPVGEYIINKPILLYTWNVKAYNSLITKQPGYAGVMFYTTYPYNYSWEGGVFSSKDEGTGAVWWLGTETATSFNIDQSKLTFRNFEAVGFKDVFAKFNSQSCIGLIEDWRVCDVEHIIGRGLTLNTETGLYTEFLPKDFASQSSWYRTPDKLTVQQGWWETGHLFKEDLDALFYVSSDTTFKDTLGVPLERTSGKDVAFCNTLKNAHFDNARTGGETGSFASVNFFGNNTQPYPYYQSVLTFSNMELTGLNSVTGVQYLLAETLTGNAQTTLKLNRTDGLPDKGIMRLGQFFTYNSIDRATNTLNLESPVISYYAEGTEIVNLTSKGVARLIAGSPDLISFNECYHGTEMGQLVGYSSYSNLDAVVAQFKNTKLETNSVALKPLYQSGLGLPPALFYANPDKYNKQLLSNGLYGAEYTITQELAGVSSVGIAMQTTSLFDTIRYKVTLTNSSENNNISVYFVDLVKSITKVSSDTMLTYKVELTIVSEGVAKITSVAINDFISDYGNFLRATPIHIQHRVNYGPKLQISLNQSTTGSVKVELVR